MIEPSVETCLRFGRGLVKKVELDLRGLTVATECASGPYAMTPLIAAMAGASVVAVGRDSVYGRFSENVSFINAMAEREGLHGAIEFHQNHCPPDVLSRVDIVTNSGGLRPIDARTISHLPSTAVISLMWETWEFRRGEIDLPLCASRGVAVIGTNEHYAPLDMYDYPGLLALKLAFDMGARVANAAIVVLGSGLTARLIAESFTSLGLDVTWYGDKSTCADFRCQSYVTLRDGFPTAPDLVICAENAYKGLVAGPGGQLDLSVLRAWSPHTQWGHISGTVDQAALDNAGVPYFPRRLLGADYMSYPTQNLGPYPVIELNTAGLLVGAIASRVRKAGGTMAEAIAAAVDHGVGMDFPGGFQQYAAAMAGIGRESSAAAALGAE